MSEIFAFFSLIQGATLFITEWWIVLFWAIPVLFGCLFLMGWLGPRLSMPAWVGGLALVFFKIGEKVGRDNLEKDYQEKAERASKKIGGRATLADLLKRLRQR